ncbi:MAG: 16S rRNA (cytosine(1402)-N(4))-methyltransferase RsmH [Patescibacteria group bacterium]
MNYHTPVLLNEILDYLNVQKGGKYIDCNLGDGGHTLEILRLGGCVLGLDIDQKSIDRAQKRIEDENLSTNFIAVCANFKDLYSVAKDNAFTECLGVLYDLGYSSTQLDLPEYGLSFLSDAPLDMRLDQNLGVTAADLINTLSERDLTRVFSEFGGENLAKKYAQAIIVARKSHPFTTTKQLSDLLQSVAPKNYEHGRINPATRVFQALRIVVNDELENLQVSLPQAAQVLLPGGRILAISFHSLEDRLVKSFGQSVRPNLKKITLKPVRPSAEEVSSNSRSRSACLRVLER